MAQVVLIISCGGEYVFITFQLLKGNDGIYHIGHGYGVLHPQREDFPVQVNRILQNQFDGTFAEKLRRQLAAEHFGRQDVAVKGFYPRFAAQFLPNGIFAFMARMDSIYGIFGYAVSGV